MVGKDILSTSGGCYGGSHMCVSVLLGGESLGFLLFLPSTFLS